MGANRPVRIGLLWHATNSGNLGVGALTESNLAILRAEACALGLVPQFVVLGFRDQAPDYVVAPDVRLFAMRGRSLLAPGGYWRELAALDCIFDIGAGDSWADIYGWRRFAYFWLSKMMAAAKGVPLVFAPQTIGPFTRTQYRLLARMAMQRATAIVVRDPMSRDLARVMVPETLVEEAIDVAFALPFDRLPARGDGLVHVGVNVSGLLFNRGYGGDNAFGLEVDYAALMRSLIAELVARSGVKLHLFTHVMAPDLAADDDCRVADMLALEFAGAERTPDFASPSAAKTFIASMDFVVSGRMHACIAAYSSGVPVVPIAYSRKFAGLFEGVLGYKHGIPVTGASTGAALATILEALANRKKIAKEIARGLDQADVALNKYRAIVRRVLVGEAL